MLNRLLILAVAAPLALPAFADNHASTDASMFLNTDIFQLEVAADIQISPDGDEVAYVRRSMDIMTDRARSNIWAVSADGDSHRPLLSGADNYSSPRWSSDGGRIAYVSDAEGRGSEIHVRWMDTGQTAMLTNVAESPSSITWSPDGRYIAFTMFDIHGISLKFLQFRSVPGIRLGFHKLPTKYVTLE